jgi:hypothetical protein
MAGWRSMIRCCGRIADWSEFFWATDGANHWKSTLGGAPLRLDIRDGGQLRRAKSGSVPWGRPCVPAS